MRDADRIIGLVEAEEKGPAQLIINRVNPALTRRGDMLNVEECFWNFWLLTEMELIPEDETVVIGSNRGLPVTLQEKSRAGRGVLRILPDDCFAKDLNL